MDETGHRSILEKVGMVENVVENVVINEVADKTAQIVEVFEGADLDVSGSP